MKDYFSNFDLHKNFNIIKNAIAELNLQEVVQLDFDLFPLDEIRIARRVKSEATKQNNKCVLEDLHFCYKYL